MLSSLGSSIREDLQIPRSAESEPNPTPFSQDSSAADPGHPAIVAAAAGPRTGAGSETAASATWTNRPARSVRIAGRATIVGSAAGRRSDAASGTAASESWTTVVRSADAAAADRASGTVTAARKSETSVTRTGSGRSASPSSATWRSRSRRNRRTVSWICGYFCVY